VSRVYSSFMDASSDLSEKGLGEGRQERVYSACVEVSGIVGISTSLLPLQYAKHSLKPSLDVVEENEVPKGGDLFYPTIVPVEGHSLVEVEVRAVQAPPAPVTTTAPPSSAPGRLKSTISNANFLEEENGRLEEIRRKREEELRGLTSAVRKAVVTFESQADEDAVAVTARPAQKKGTVAPGKSQSELQPPQLNPGDVNIWDERGSLQLDASGQVKAGNLNQLLLHLTHPHALLSDSISGSGFFNTFMVTLQTFTTPEQFVRKLIERYSVPPHISAASSTDLSTLKTTQAKVCNIM